MTKTVNNDAGGTADANAFQGEIDGTSQAWGVARTVSVGAHTASESGGPAEYTAGSWGGDCAADGSITLAADENATCTITNTFVPPETAASLTVIKVVENVGGTGTAVVGDFTLKIDTDEVTSGDPNVLPPGAYTVSETWDTGAFPGYTGVISGDCAADGSVTLDADDRKTCTITNTFDPPLLTVTKLVFGGIASPNDFNLQVDGTPVNSGDQNPFSADIHMVTETQLEGYTITIWSGDCSGEGGEGEVDMTGAEPGEAFTCTITNIDPSPFLTVDKTVIGDGDPNSFNLQVDGQGVLDEQQNQFPPGTYLVSETNLAGYNVGDWNEDCAADGSVSLEVIDAQSEPGSWFYLCTITNVSTTTTTTTTTTTVAPTTATQGGTATTRGFTATTTTDPGGTTTTTLVLGPDLPNTGAGNLFPIWLGGFGLMLLGAGLVLLSPRNRPQWVV